MTDPLLNMKFLIDVNVGGSITDWLIDSGHDVVEVRDNDPCMHDTDILNWAIKEKRVIITTDNDFEKMIWQQKKDHCGVLRMENLPRIERMKLIKDVFSHHINDLQSGAIVIASLNKYRIRRSQ